MFTVHIVLAKMQTDIRYMEKHIFLLHCFSSYFTNVFCLGSSPYCKINAFVYLLIKNTETNNKHDQ